MAERKTGAGLHLSGVLERSTRTPTPPEPEEPESPDQADDSAEPEPASNQGRGRGASPPARRSRSSDGRAAKKIKGRTIYLPDDLFERIMVQAHRRDKTISEYVQMILERQVPDHRTIRAEPAGGEG